MIALTFRPMTANDAANISAWQYPKPYDVYNLEPHDPETIALLCEAGYYAAYDQSGELAGFCCTGAEARVPGGYLCGAYDDACCIDVGLGMRPDLTGQGNGAAFSRALFDFVNSLYPDHRIRISVMTFNHRAITAYRKAGFCPAMCFSSAGHTFLLMIR